MNADARYAGWDEGTWLGSRRAQLRRSAGLSVRERLEALEQLADTSSRLALLRERRPAYPVDPTRHEILLSACAPAPLASYLKALGVLRLVCEQADAGATGCWRKDGFVLISQLDETGLQTFLLEHYRPTPLVAPWGARSGFYPGSSESTARAALERIAESDLERLAPFRAAITDVRRLLQRLGMTTKAQDVAKLALLRACRAELSDDVLPWLDACYVLTDEDRAFPPLLGTGGNEGSGSYVSGFAQQVVACLVEREWDHALAASLFGGARPNTASDQTPGQFSPLAAGGANATSGFEGKTALNPWDFLLCLEGTLLFAAAATKRLETLAPGMLAYPFTVQAVGAGAGTVALGDEPNARAETWFPLWDQPATLAELNATFAEGRVQVNGRTARDALDFARAVAALGLQRGISAFQRYGYLQRFGRNVIAVPIERVQVRRNPHGDLIDDLDRDSWLRKLRDLARRRDPDPPARLQSLIRRLEDALFDLTRGVEPARVQAVLMRLGEVQLYLAHSAGTRTIVSPVPELSGDWMTANDRSDEFHIAAALAGLHATERRSDGTARPALRMLAHFAPVDERRRWLEASSHEVTWGSGDLVHNLGDLAGRRMQLAAKLNLLDAPWQAYARAPLAAVSAWLQDGLDEQRISDLLPGLVLVRRPNLPKATHAAAPAPPPAYTVLKPLFVTRGQLIDAKLIPASGNGFDDHSHGIALADAARVARLLVANRVDEAVARGVRRLRSYGIATLSHFKKTAHPDGKRLLAALLVPISDHDLRSALARVTVREKDER